MPNNIKTVIERKSQHFFMTISSFEDNLIKAMRHSPCFLLICEGFRDAFLAKACLDNATT